jgi:hypothetical protein
MHERTKKTHRWEENVMTFRIGQAVTVAVIYMLGATTAFAQSNGSLRGKISSYECGDNCYLTITDEFGATHTGLCVADACRSWNQAAHMPRRYIGRSVVARVGMGTQLDGSGAAVGRMMAFRALHFR